MRLPQGCGDSQLGRHQPAMERQGLLDSAGHAKAWEAWEAYQSTRVKEMSNGADIGGPVVPFEPEL